MDLLDDMGVSKLSAIFFFKVNYSFKAKVSGLYSFPVDFRSVHLCKCLLILSTNRCQKQFLKVHGLKKSVIFSVIHFLEWHSQLFQINCV